MQYRTARVKKVKEDTLVSPTVPNIPTPVSEKLMNSRIVWLNGEVNDESANDVASKLLVLSGQDPTSDILFFINSPGGSVTAGSMLADVMNLIPNDVVTVGFGMAASMGQFLLTQGAEGKRFATPMLRVLLHQPLGGYGGQSDDILTQANLIDSMKETLASYTAARTGHSVEKVMIDGDRDNWFTADEALDYGFVDHIIQGDLMTLKKTCLEVDAAKGTPEFAQYQKNNVELNEHKGDNE